MHINESSIFKKATTSISFGSLNDISLATTIEMFLELRFQKRKVQATYFLAAMVSKALSHGVKWILPYIITTLFLLAQVGSAITSDRFVGLLDFS